MDAYSWVRFYHLRAMGDFGLRYARRVFGPWRPHAGRILAVCMLALVAYSNSFQCGLVFDNAIVIGRDARIREAAAANLGLILTQNYWYGRSESHLYRPLTTLSFLFNYALLGGGTDPATYHWVNFALHAANIALVYLLVLLLAGEKRLAFAAAALWGLHPVLTESVTNIVGRADLLAAFGILGGLLAHTRAANAAGRRKALWLAALAMAAAVAVFSKESGVLVLAAIALFDLWFRPGPGWRARVPGYLAAGLPVAVLLALRAHLFGSITGEPVPFTDNPLAAADFWTARLTAVAEVGRYFGLLVWPLRLSCDYSYNQVPLAGWSDWRVLLPLAACIGALAAAAWLRRRAPAATWLAVLFFAMLAPVSNLLFPVGTIMAERFLYLPAVGFIACAVLAWRAAERRWAVAKSSGRIVLAVVCALLAVRTWARNSDWSTGASLWSSATAAAPNSYKAHYHLAAVTPEAPESREQALREADRSLAILDPLPDDRNVSAPYATAARWYRVEGDALPSPEQKATWYRKALGALLRARRIDREESLRLGREVGNEEVYVELGRVYRRLSRPNDALEALEYGRRAALGDAVCEELAGLYQSGGESERAAVTYMEALSMNPGRTAIAAKLAGLYRQLDPGGCSLANGGLNLACPLVRGHLCAAARNVAQLYRKAGNQPAAVKLESQAAANFGCPAG